MLVSVNSCLLFRSCVCLLVLTDTTSESKQRCQQAGMNDFLTKPFRIETLVQMLKKAYISKQDKSEESGR